MIVSMIGLLEMSRGHKVASIAVVHLAGIGVTSPVFLCRMYSAIVPWMPFRMCQFYNEQIMSTGALWKPSFSPKWSLSW